MASELDLGDRAPTVLDVATRGPTEWDSTEYVPMAAGDVPRYAGPYEVTPRAHEQVTLPTEGLLMGADVTINPIPSNYGLITWNGATLTVS